MNQPLRCRAKQPPERRGLTSILETLSKGFRALRQLLHGLHRLPRETFSLRVQRRDAPDAPPTRIVPPFFRYHADPFVIERDGQIHVFFEEFDYLSCRGRIATLRLDAQGHPSPPLPVLDLPYHLSYPFLLEEDCHLYMVPESSQNRSLDLYRCEDFPLHWRLEQRLMSDLDAADTTILRHDGRTWIFTSMRDALSGPGQRHLCIFHGKHLLGQQWTPHPINARRLYGDLPHGSGRCAGGFIHHEGRLLRPSQHNVHHYGEGIRFHEIRHLTETEFEEMPVDVTDLPFENLARLGIHHLSCHDRLLLADVRDRVDWPWRSARARSRRADP